MRSASRRRWRPSGWTRAPSTTRAFDYARFFDISITFDGETVQPAPGSSVEVRIELADTASDTLSVVHFGESAEVLESAAESGAVDFETTGFSVYAIVEAPEPVPPSGWKRAATLEEIAALGQDGFYVRHPGGYYFTNIQYSISGSRTGIQKTKPAASNPDVADGAVKYYFEPVDGTDDQFRVRCLADNGDWAHVAQSSNSLSLTTADRASVFTISPFPNNANTFRVLGTGGYYWNMQGGEGGNGFAAYNSATDANARIQLEFYARQEDDPYDLKGKSFGIAWHDESANSAALTATGKTVNNQQRLEGFDMLMRPDVLDHDGILLVAQDSDIQEWTFTGLEGDAYYLTTVVDGATKYLTIDGGNVTLEDAPDPDHSVIRAIPGTGANAGKWRFLAGDYSLNFTGNVSNGFNAVTGSGAGTWMNLAQESVLTEEDFTLYNAKKVSVSDRTNVYDGQQVVLYTRVWNGKTNQYEFYAVDFDGKLVRCYDTGDAIEWIGTQVNTALWDFVEYKNADGTPNDYYELMNVQYGDCLAPQLSGARIFSDDPVGINLNGRRFGDSFTTIVAWDDARYAYAGLKVEDGRVVACPLSEAQDFNFAVVNPIDPDDTLTTVDTVNSNAFGIEMKMIDFQNGNIGSLDSPRDAVQNPFFGGDQSGKSGLLSTDLDGGYPTTTDLTGRAGHSLSELYAGATPVNHLFIQSIYNESGYFE